MLVSLTLCQLNHVLIDFPIALKKKHVHLLVPKCSKNAQKQAHPVQKYRSQDELVKLGSNVTCKT